jgi:hypothetical protein
MGIEDLNSGDDSEDDSSNDDTKDAKVNVETSYFNESKPHTSSKKRVSEQLSEDGYETSLEHTIRTEQGKHFRIDVYAKCVDSSQQALDGVTEGDSVAVLVGQVDAVKLKILCNNLQYVGIVPKGSGIPDMVTASTEHQTDADDETKKSNIMTSTSRSERTRGPYIDDKAYEKLKKASNNYDMTVQDTIDLLLHTTLNDEGNVRQQHSVLRNEMKNP